jgi:hypothetical protein
MKRQASHLLPGALLFLLACACTTERAESWRQGTTTLKATGTPGAKIAGFYVQNGQRREIASDLPYVLSDTGIAEAELRKVNPNEAISVEAHFTAHGMKAAFANMIAPSGVPGIRVQLQRGFVVEQLKE